MKYTLCLIIFHLYTIVAVFPIWKRNVVSYERGVYQAGFQNWMVAQSQNGWMYFANSKGVLEFDGVYWNLYPINNKIVRSVKIIDDRIYVGANSDFGFLKRNAIGKLIYHSLSKQQKEWGGDIWSIAAIGDDKIFFLADNAIFIYNPQNNKIVTISTDIKIDYCSTVVNGRLYLATTDGLFYLDEKNSLVFVKQSKQIVGEKIVGLTAYDGCLLVTTARSGIFLIDDSGCNKIRSIADGFIQNNQLFCSLIVDSKMVLGSVQGGAFVFDLNDPSYKEVFDINSGLSNNTVLSLLVDKNKNLWLGLDKGISYIDLNSPIRPLFPVNSPIGTGYCSVVYNNEFYLGTNQGLYKLDRRGNYQLINDSEGQIWSLNIIDDTLFCAGDNGVIVITPKQVYKVKVMGAWSVERLNSDKNTLIVGTYSGFRLVDRVNGVWSNVRVVKGFTNSCRGFIEDDVDNVFWMANAWGNVEKITIDPKSAEIIDQKEYTLGAASLGENTFFRKIHNSLVICGDNGIYQYSRISDEFTPHSDLESMLNGSRYYDFLNSDSKGNIWFVSDKRLKMLPFRNGDYTGHIIDWGLNNELIDNSENIMLLDSSSVIVSVDKGFSKINLDRKDISSLPLEVHIRKLVTTVDDSIVDYNNSGNVIEIPYSRNSIHIYFAATEYSHSSDVIYSFRLKGQDSRWSTPSAKTMKEYTNLTEGEYIFEVKAFIKGYENSGNIASIHFEILPPWYRSVWAYIIYILFLFCFSIVLYRKTIKKQKLIIQQKGYELEAQMKQYEQERILKDKEIYELQNENLRNNLSYKTQELTGYILNIIRKNEMLEDVRNEVIKISKALDENKQIGIIKQKVVRLTTRISNNIERDKDFEAFQSNFNLIHKDFFKYLDEKYPGLTRNDKILCAYLKMNFSSKEIAPLQNISVRGVEVNRYRLRKKMNLDRNVNLNEFMQSLSYSSENIDDHDNL